MAIEIAQAAGRKHDTVRRQQQRALAPNRGDAGDRFLAQDQAPRFDILEHGDRCRAPHGGDHRLQDRMAGAVAFGMDDAAVSMRGFEAEGERPSAARSRTPSAISASIARAPALVTCATTLASFSSSPAAILSAA